MRPCFTARHDARTHSFPHSVLPRALPDRPRVPAAPAAGAQAPETSDCCLGVVAVQSSTDASDDKGENGSMAVKTGIENGIPRLLGPPA